MLKEQLKELFNTALREDYKYIAVQIEMEGFKKPEIIINRVKQNGEDKLKYYDKVYDENLIHKFSKEKIQIIECVYGDSMSEIGEKLGEERIWR